MSAIAFTRHRLLIFVFFLLQRQSAGNIDLEIVSFKKENASAGYFVA